MVVDQTVACEVVHEQRLSPVQLHLSEPFQFPDQIVIPSARSSR